MNTQHIVTQVVAAIDSGQICGAIQPLLPIWRTYRCPIAAQLIGALSAADRDTGQPLKTGRSKAALAAWMRVAQQQRSADLPRLLFAIPSVPSPTALERLDALAAWPADPRLTDWALELIRSPPWTGLSTRPFWSRLFELIITQADGRAHQAIAPLVADYYPAVMTGRLGPWMRGRLGALVQRLPAPRAPVLAGPDEARIRTALAARAALPPSPKQALLAEIAADLADDLPRLVLADLLTEAENPRGEFIALQLSRAAAGVGPEAAHHRESQLLRAHRAEWLGPLDRIISKPVFERGFLTRGDLGRKVPNVRPAIGDARWRTVERLHVWFPSEPRLEALWGSLLEHDVVTAGIQLGGFTGFDTIERIAQRLAPKISAMVLSRLEPQEVLRAQDLVKQLPGLRRLNLSYRHWAQPPAPAPWLAAVPQVRDLSLPANAVVSDWLSALRPTAIQRVRRRSRDLAIALQPAAEGQWSLEACPTLGAQPTPSLHALMELLGGLEPGSIAGFQLVESLDYLTRVGELSMQAQIAIRAQLLRLAVPAAAIRL